MFDAPFAAVNADDYYGPGGMKEIYEFLKTSAQSGEYCMVGYELLKTLSDNGSVARGVCEVDETHRLLSVTERTHIVSTRATARCSPRTARITSVCPTRRSFR